MVSRIRCLNSTTPEEEVTNIDCLISILPGTNKENGDPEPEINPC